MQMKSRAVANLGVRELELQRLHFSWHIIFCMRCGEQQTGNDRDTVNSGGDILPDGFCNCRTRKFQITVSHSSAGRSLFYKPDEAFELDESFRIAAPMSSNDNIVPVSRRHISVLSPRSPVCVARGSSWLGIGCNVRMRMMLISLNVPVQFSRFPDQAASACVKCSQTSTGCSGGMPRDTRKCDTWSGMKSHGRGMTIAFRPSSRTCTRCSLNGPMSPRL